MRNGRVLQEPRLRAHNVRIYDSEGTILASLQANSRQSYVTYEMVYRYCRMIFIIPNEQRWSIFNLMDDESIGQPLRHDRRATIKPGNFVVLGHQGRTPITIKLTTEHAPRRVITEDRSSGSQGQSEKDQLQSHFRTSVRARDTVCAFTNKTAAVPISNDPSMFLETCHIFPMSRLSEWNMHNYRRYITDPSPAISIGKSGLYSAQNGLLLGPEVHLGFNAFGVGVDPDADYKIIVFGEDTKGLGGATLRSTARDGTNSHNRVSPDLLRWHLRMCVYANMKANPEPDVYWENDLGSDNMGQILEQPDAAERMEVELFTRLGGLVA